MNMTPIDNQTLPKAMLTSFAFTNTAGGTGCSNWQHNKRFDAPCEVGVTRVFFDDETGWHFAGVGLSQELQTYLGEVCSPDDQRVLFTERDLADASQVHDLIHQLAQLAGVAKTGDGYTFHRQPDGTWTDDDMTWSNLDEMMGAVDISIEVGASVTPPKGLAPKL